MTETIRVNLIKSKKISDSKSLTWPQKYEDFIKDIKEKFQLNENTKIILTLFTKDEDDSEIKSQDDLDAYLEAGSIDHFNFEFEGDIKPEELPVPIGQNPPMPNPDPKLDILEIDIDKIIKEVFDNDTYKKELEINNKKLSDNFKSSLELSINTIIEENQKVLVNDIDSKIKIVVNDFSQKQNSNKSSFSEIKDDFEEIKDKIDEMNSAIKDFKDKFKPENFSKIIRSDIDNPIKVKFEQKNIEKTIETKDAKFININNINIKNVGNTSIHKLYFFKDQEKSSNDFCFFGNSKAINEYELTMPGEFEPNQSLPYTISMNINNPKPGQEYKAIIYAKENKDIISDPFEIIIKINKPQEDQMKQKQIQANQIYDEIKSQFLNHEDLVNKNDIINKLIQNNLNKDEIINEINNAIKEKEQKEINSKAEKVYNELNMDNVNLDKKEVLDYIKENKFNKEEVQKWIDEKKPKQEKDNPANDKFEEEVNKIYQELDEGYSISGFIEEEEAKKQIRKLNLDREAIIDWVENTLI